MGKSQVSLETALDDFVTKLKRRQLAGSLNLARRTTELMIHAVAAQHVTSVEGVIQGVAAVGKRLVDARPLELVVGNMVRRVLFIIREEGVAFGASGGEGGIDGEPDEDEEEDEEEEEGGAGGSAGRFDKIKRFKQDVIEMISELIDELDTVPSQIAQQALEHITPNMTVLTSGGSDMVELFLREANKKRKFQAVVAEGAPGYTGHKTARMLADKGVETTAVSDSAVFALMSRVNLVVIAACGVFANGGVLARAGLHAVALTAKRHAVPIVILAGLHEFSPLTPNDPEFALNDLGNPSHVLPYSALEDCLPDPGVASADAASAPSLTVANPSFDYIPPELVSLFITDTGGQVPAFVSTLLGEIYSPLDNRLGGD